MPLPSIDDISSYGGNKVDFSTIVDPTTDRSAVEVNAAFASTAASTRTAVRAYLQFTGIASDPVPNFHQAVWGSTVAVIPVILRSSTGVFDITFPATVIDGTNSTQAVNLKLGWGSIEGDTLAHAQVSKTGPNSFRVNLFDVAGTASDLIGVLVNVFVI